jgi:hypothetical protein
MHVETFLQEFGELLLQKVEMAFPATIMEYNKNKETATIRPMLFSKNGPDASDIVDMPDIKDVPVERPFGIKPNYKKGDLVRVSLYASSIKQAFQNTRANQLADRFSFSYCSVSCGLKYSIVEGHYIWFDDTAANVSGLLKVSNDVVVNGVSFNQLKADFDALKASYDPHEHPAGTLVAPSGGGPVTGVTGGHT